MQTLLSHVSADVNLIICMWDDGGDNLSHLPVVVFVHRLFLSHVSADVNPFTCMWDDGGNRWEVHHCVIVRVEAVIQPYEALGWALSHAMVTGYQDIDATPEAGPLQLWHQQANVVVNLFAYKETQPSIKVCIEHNWSARSSVQIWLTFKCSEPTFYNEFPYLLHLYYRYSKKETSYHPDFLIQ